MCACARRHRSQSQIQQSTKQMMCSVHLAVKHHVCYISTCWNKWYCAFTADHPVIPAVLVLAHLWSGFMFHVSYFRNLSVMWCLSLNLGKLVKVKSCKSSGCTLWNVMGHRPYSFKHLTQEAIPITWPPGEMAGDIIRSMVMTSMYPFNGLSSSKSSS